MNHRLPPQLPPPTLPLAKSSPTIIANLENRITKMFLTPFFLHDDLDDTITIVVDPPDEFLPLLYYLVFLIVYPAILISIHVLDEWFHILPRLRPRRKPKRQHPLPTRATPTRKRKSHVRRPRLAVEKPEPENPLIPNPIPRRFVFADHSSSDSNQGDSYAGSKLEEWNMRQEARYSEIMRRNSLEYEIMVLDHLSCTTRARAAWEVGVRLPPMVPPPLPIIKKKREPKIRFNDHVEKFEYEPELPSRLRRASQPLILIISQKLQSKEIQEKKLSTRLRKKLVAMRRRKKVRSSMPRIRSFAKTWLIDLKRRPRSATVELESGTDEHTRRASTSESASCRQKVQTMGVQRKKLPMRIRQKLLSIRRRKKVGCLTPRIRHFAKAWLTQTCQGV